MHAHVQCGMCVACICTIVLQMHASTVLFFLRKGLAAFAAPTETLTGVTAALSADTSDLSCDSLSVNFSFPDFCGSVATPSRSALGGTSPIRLSAGFVTPPSSYICTYRHVNI